MIYSIEARPVGSSGYLWVGGGNRFSHRDRAEDYRKTVQHYLDTFCLVVDMETRVVETEGDILDEARV